MKTVNGYDVNTVGQVTPWSQIEEDNFTYLLGYMPSLAAATAGNTVTANHGHSLLKRPDNTASLITGLNTNRIGFQTSTPLCPLHFSSIGFGSSGLNPGATTLAFYETNGLAGSLDIELANPVAVSACRFLFRDGTAGHNGSIEYNFNNSMTFWTNNAQRTTILSSGYFGINKATPVSWLHVAGVNSGATGGGVATFEGDGDTSTNKVYFLSPNADSFTLFFGDVASNSIGRICYDHSADFMYFCTNGATERLRITSTGLFGFMSSAPASAIDIDKDCGGAAMGYITMAELNGAADAAAPAADHGALYLRDNGAGKTQLCVRFNSGAVQVLATQP